MKNIFTILFLASMAFASTVSAATVRDTTEIINNTADKAGVPKNTADGLLTDFLMWLLAIFTLLAVISFIVSGLMFLFSGADKNLADKARSGVSYSIIGIVVALSAYIVIFLINSILSGTVDVGPTIPPTTEV